MNDTIDRSIEQKKIRVEQLRKELDALGYHVVSKEWLTGLVIALSNFDKAASK